MKIRIYIAGLFLVASMLMVAGCLEPFTGGVVAGVGAVELAARQQIAEAQKQANIEIEAAQKEAEKAKQLAEKIKATVDKIKDPDVLAYLESIADPNTIANIKELKSTDWKDPVVSSGYALAVLSTITAAYQKYQRAKKA